jgi:hypothetical protein
MGLLSSKPASEACVNEVVQNKIGALLKGAALDTMDQLLIIAAAAVRAERERTSTPGPIKRIEVAVILYSALEKMGTERMRAIYPTAQSLEATVEIVYVLSSKLGSDVFTLLRALSVGKNRVRQLNVVVDESA